MLLLNLLNQPIVLVDLFMINITPNIFYFRFIFSAYFIFKLIQIIFSPGLCSWRYHRQCLAGTQSSVCIVYCLLCCTFYVVIKKKTRKKLKGYDKQTFPWKESMFYVHSSSHFTKMIYTRNFRNAYTLFTTCFFVTNIQQKGMPCTS